MTSNHPGDAVELAPQLPLLQEAATEEQHQISVEEQQKQVCMLHTSAIRFLLHNITLLSGQEQLSTMVSRMSLTYNKTANA